jgi:hypothetical protein
MGLPLWLLFFYFDFAMKDQLLQSY